jgi:predicted RNA-binding Zn-ribbon protein involved in translation (DUF1610 family)
MADEGFKIIQQNGAHHLCGVLNETANLSSLLKASEPLRLDMQEVSRLNSIGVRNLLKFLSGWGGKAFSYERCPGEFIDQVNMIPALLGTKRQGTIKSLYVPYECPKCEHEEEVLGDLAAYVPGIATGAFPQHKCPNCGDMMTVVTDSFFVFATR